MFDVFFVFLPTITWDRLYEDRDSPCKGLSIFYVRKIFRKTNISDPLIRTRTCAYHDP